MMAVKKKTSLAAAMGKSKTPTPTTVVTGSDRPKSRQGKKAVSGFFLPEVSKQLKFLAIEQDTTLQALLTEALNDLFTKHSKNPIA